MSGEKDPEKGPVERAMDNVRLSDAHPEWARKGLAQALALYKATHPGGKPLEPDDVRLNFINMMEKVLTNGLQAEIAKEEAREHAESARDQGG